MEKPRKIIIDTDPGQDDAIALLLALASPEIEVLGLSVVAGNVPLQLTTINARKICELAGRPDLPIYAGAEVPLMRTLVTAEHVHGKNGLDGPDLPDPQMPLQTGHAVDYLIDTLMQEDVGAITLCALGPLTNLALALRKEPKIAPRIREIILMGGAFSEGGNITPSAEFNFYVDPHAAKIVFGAGVPLVMMPLDVTHQALTSDAALESIAAPRTAVAVAAHALLNYHDRFDAQKYGGEGAPLHDPCVIAYLVNPALFSGRQCNVEIETESSLTQGMSVVDWWSVTGREKNAMVMRSIDRDGFFSLLTERLGRYL
ncbi:nucleoside hydrolase [Limoniibacter endophyticus]|uniref:Ribosylpyrimidine nucleosidase n=1 Tax=Limoniibacter endophyticus TaxID=1565040 RepID=A0A8J3DG51_9HYPH|nr:nucleoside hydrolase [Limoniibacter endophyticus]GHC66585.1 ribosylpyrimidine nucleosidase [Limoniibacter endophyticus]